MTIPMQRKNLEGKIDAFFCTAGAQTTVIGELAKKCDIRLLSIDEKSAEKLKEHISFIRTVRFQKRRIMDRQRMLRRLV